MPWRHTRLARPTDWAEIVRIHSGRNREYLPEFFQRDERGILTEMFQLPVIFALVTVDEDGSVTAACYYELCAEQMFVGGDPVDTLELRSHIDEAAYILRQKGIESLHCQVPRELLKEGRHPDPITRSLRVSGFTRDDHRLGHFYKNLR